LNGEREERGEGRRKASGVMHQEKVGANTIKLDLIFPYFPFLFLLTVLNAPL